MGISPFTTSTLPTTYIYTNSFFFIKIVEERADATNVNNWHWAEKNCTPWSKERLRDLFSKTLLLEEDLGSVVLAETVTVEGDATANNRKGKLIFFYELTLKVDWNGE